MSLEVKNLDAADEKRSFDHGQVDLVALTAATVGRAVFNPGWRWSTDVKPTAGTSSCQVAHLGYVMSGRFHVRMDDGTEVDLGPGDAHVVPPGHDAWVVGDEQCVILDIARDAGSGRSARCPCGVEFRSAGEAPEALDHLVAAIQEHARGSHGQEVSAEHIFGELIPT